MAHAREGLDQSEQLADGRAHPMHGSYWPGNRLMLGSEELVQVARRDADPAEVPGEENDRADPLGLQIASAGLTWASMRCLF
jgi:hypothetical protein